MGVLESKTCIVTGGAGRIGLATARLFLAEGARAMWRRIAARRSYK